MWWIIAAIGVIAVAWLVKVILMPERGLHTANVLAYLAHKIQWERQHPGGNYPVIEGIAFMLQGRYQRWSPEQVRTFIRDNGITCAAEAILAVGQMELPHRVEALRKRVYGDPLDLFERISSTSELPK